MIIHSRHLLLILAVAAFLTACSDLPGNAATGNANVSSNAGAAKPVAAAPTAATLLALETKADEAFKKGDGQWFEGLLSDQFVMQVAGKRVSKADLVKMINGLACQAKPGWTYTQPQLLKVDNDVYVLSYVSNMDGSCTMGGNTVKMLSPLRVSTVWVRNGGQWQFAFQGQNQIVDPKATQASAGNKAPRQADRPSADADTATPSTPAKPTNDAITNTLMAAENTLWDAWKKKDANKIEALTAKEISFVDIFGNYSANKADALKVWTGPACDIASFKLTDGVGTSVSPGIGILTLTGVVNGSCGGQDISGQKIYGNTVYIRDGDTWKWVFGFNSPSR